MQSADASNVPPTVAPPSSVPLHTANNDECVLGPAHTYISSPMGTASETTTTGDTSACCCAFLCNPSDTISAVPSLGMQNVQLRRPLARLAVVRLVCPSCLSVVSGRRVYPFIWRSRCKLQLSCSCIVVPINKHVKQLTPLTAY